jgi:hypothetical protein
MNNPDQQSKNPAAGAWRAVPLPRIVAFLGGLWYLVQSWRFAHTQSSVLDEGLYLYKGWLYASGTYTPFQNYGPWSNHMPLSFLLPGWAQAIFGPGLLTGRMFALALGLLSLLGVWLLVRRISVGTQHSTLLQVWLPSLAVWAIALNPAIIKVFSIQASQGLAACLVIWALVGILGPAQKPWQIWLGAILLGAIPLTRINLLPILPLGILYLYWEHGKSRGTQALLLAAAVFFGLHALYWPNILRMWVGYFPREYTPFFDAFRRAPGALPSWTPTMGFDGRWRSFWQGLRFHFLALMGVVSLLLFWPKKWQAPHKKTVVFLLINFAVLFGLHAWAALGQSYCVFCFTPYLSFFSLTGLILFAAALPALEWQRPPRWLITLLIFGLAIGIGHNLADSLGYELIRESTVVGWLKSDIPRTGGEGTIPLWGFIENRWGWDFEASVTQGFRFMRALLTSGLGILTAFLIVSLSKYLPSHQPPRAPARLWSTFLIAGLLLSPTTALGGGYTTYDCSGDVLEAYATAGAYLDQQIPRGSHIYWETGDSPVPLLYLNEIEIYPPQLNNGYSFKIGGAPDELVKFGHWNQELAEQWASEADVILLDNDAFDQDELSWLIDIISTETFDNVPATNPLHPCQPDSRIHIFVRESIP